MSLSLLMNLKRCTGCWACAMGCKTGNDTPEGEWWEFVRTIGGGDGVDDPGGVWPDLHMSWMPTWTQKCTKCAPRIAEGKRPYCVNSCPTHAITLGDPDDPDSDFSKEKARLQNMGYRTYKLQNWENTKDWVVYADK